MAGNMCISIRDVEHGACAFVWHTESSKLAMIDSGHNTTDKWYPSEHIKYTLKRDTLDYLFITNADQDHLDDLNGLWEREVQVRALIRAKGISSEDLRKLKMETARDTGLGADIERFLSIHHSYNAPTTEPFADHMGGIKYRAFWNNYPDQKTTNNLSMAVFFEYAGFKILFPGDLEKSGWSRLLQLEDFRQELDTTTVLVASHHGRENGFCAEVFAQPELNRFWQPSCVVFSDKSSEHGTQEGMSKKYGNHCKDEGVITKGCHQRWVLTTRDDGWIRFCVEQDGTYSVNVQHDHA